MKICNMKHISGDLLLISQERSLLRVTEHESTKPLGGPFSSHISTAYCPRLRCIMEMPPNFPTKYRMKSKSSVGQQHFHFSCLSFPGGQSLSEQHQPGAALTPGWRPQAPPSGAEWHPGMGTGTPAGQTRLRSCRHAKNG